MREAFHDLRANGAPPNGEADHETVRTASSEKVARLRAEWDRRGIKPIGLSVDPVEAHRERQADIVETQGVTLDFPMIADADRRVSTLYGMIHPAADPTVTVRSVYVVNPAKKVRLILTHSPSTGRNLVEILRAVDSLQLIDARCIATFSP